MDQKIEFIKNWLGTGSINIFGMPYSGKDTLGIRLAEALGAKFLSSGLILRAAEEQDRELRNELASGVLVDTDKFRGLVLPYLFKPELMEFPLVLSSVGRWSGEEFDVIEATRRSAHALKAVVLLNISETELKNRWQTARTLQDRGQRSDDKDLKILDKRIAEFTEKTMPVIETYQKLNILLPVNGHQTRDEVYNSVVDALYKFAVDTSRQVTFDAPQDTNLASASR